jgi:hypothetical protein
VHKIVSAISTEYSWPQEGAVRLVVESSRFPDSPQDNIIKFTYSNANDLSLEELESIASFFQKIVKRERASRKKMEARAGGPRPG